MTFWCGIYCRGLFQILSIGYRLTHEDLKQNLSSKEPYGTSIWQLFKIDVRPHAHRPLRILALNGLWVNIQEMGFSRCITIIIESTEFWLQSSATHCAFASLRLGLSTKICNRSEKIYPLAHRATTMSQPCQTEPPND